MTEIPPEVAEALKDSSRHVGRFVLVNLLGKGGMGMVFRAWEPELHRWVALKFLKQIGDETARAYFKREAQLAAGLDHPNVAKIYEVGEHGGSPFIAMQYVDGDPLSGKDRNLGERLRIVKAVAEAVKYAHEKRVIHRDLKPANVMVGTNGQVFVMDFGLAKETTVEGESLGGSSLVVGTPSYMAPEQAKGKADHQSDLYAIGAILYELMTGRPPFTGQTSTEILDQVIHQEPVWPRKLSPDTPADVEAIILHALEKDNRRRYTSASEIIADVAAVLDKNPLHHARRPTMTYLLGKKIRKQPLLWAFGTLVILALLGSAAFGGQALADKGKELVQQAEAESRARRDAEDRQRIEKEEREKAEGQRKLALEARTRAGEERKRAETQKERAAEGLSDSYSRRARQELEHERPSLALSALLSARALAARDTPLNRIDLAGKLMPGLYAMLVHENDVMAMSFSPDGKLLLTASLDKTARVWNVETGEPDGEILRHENPVLAAEFTPDGARIISVSGEAAHIWDAKSRKKIAEVRHVKTAKAIALSSDGSVAASGDQEGTVLIWDSRSGAVQKTIKTPGDIDQLLLDPKGKRLAARFFHWQCGIWDVESASAVNGGWSHERVEWLSFDPEGKRLALSSHEGHGELYDLATGRPIGQPMKHHAWVGHIEFSPDGKRLVTASFDRTARIWDARTAQALEEGVVARPMFHDREVTMARFSPDGRWVITGGFDKMVRVWSLDARWMTGLDFCHDDYILDARISPDGTRAATLAKGRVVRLWHLSGSPMWKAPAVLFRFSPDGSRVATASLDGTIQLRNAETGAPLGHAMKHEDVSMLLFSSDGRRLRSESEKLVKVWDGTTGEPVGQPVPTPGYPVEFSKDGRKLLITLSLKELQIWNAETMELISEKTPFKDAFEIWTASFSNELKLKQPGVSDLWEKEVGEPFGRLIESDAGDLIQYDFHGDTVAVFGSGIGVKLWDLKAGRAIGKEIRLDDAVRRVGFSPDGRRLAAANSRETIPIVDGMTGSPVGEGVTFPGRAYGTMAFSPDSRWLAAGDRGGRVTLWSAEEGLRITRPFPSPAYVRGLVFSSDGRKLASLDGNAEVSLWNLEFTGDTTSAERLKLTAEATTGARLDDRDEAAALSVDEWRALQAQLREMKRK